MVDIKPITDRVSVSHQISLDDIDRLKELGVVTVIMNRPDGEEPGQPERESLKSAAEAAGMRWVDVPVSGGQFSLDAIDAMATAIQRTEDRVHAFCRTGTRSCFLWSFAEAMAGDTPLEAIQQAAANAGYDVSPGAMMMEDLRASKS